ncbi:MAG: LptF/LptG family permease [Planctomycetota bacterium]|nr:LptF/LptG family permease [Planctomycetota bacterium]
MFGGILFRMIFWELTKVFGIALFAITGILLMAGIVAEATQQGLGPAQILGAIPLLVPSTLPYTIPATTLFAACVVYGRLAADNEILAIKAAGVNLAAVVMPGIILGFAMSAMTMGLYYRVIPYTHHLLRSLVFRDAEELIYTVLKKQGMLSHSQLPYAMFVKGVQGRKLINPTFKRRDAKGDVDVVAQAREAHLRVNLAKQQMLIHMRHGVASTDDGSRGYFEDRVWEVPLPANLANDADRRARDMTWQEILAKRQEWLESIDRSGDEIQVATAKVDSNPADANLSKHVVNLQNRLKHERQQLRFLDVELQMRPALSFGCLCFILVGCPVGIWFSRGDYLSAFITCFLPVVVSYYPLMLCGTGMAKDGKLDIVTLVWGADLMLASAGLLLIWRLTRN